MATDLNPVRLLKNLLKSEKSTDLGFECRVDPQLAQVFAELNARWFGGQLPFPFLIWNSRLRSSAGRFVPGYRKDWSVCPPVIEVATYLRKIDDSEHHIRDTLAHEMIHFWLWVRRRPYGHNEEFWKKLEEVGASRYNPVPVVRPPKHLYQCPGCAKTVPARRRLKRNMACRSCCNLHSGGKWDLKFVLVRVENATEHR